MRHDIVSLRIDSGTAPCAARHAVQLALYAMTSAGGTGMVPATMATWSSSKPAIAEVNRQGRLMPLQAGVVTIKVAYLGCVAETTLTVAA